jgi:phosphoribosylformylglycinamidine cyclo-ligase
VIHPLLEKHEVKGMAHITGGGLPGNLNRIIPNGLSARITKGIVPRPPIFDFLQHEGNIDEAEMYRAFNMGVGYVLVVDPKLADAVIGSLSRMSEKAYQIGEIKKGDCKVVLI